MNFFNDCKTTEEVRKRYQKLAMEHHPDHGGSNEMMQEINRQYAEASARASQGSYETEEEAEYDRQMSEEYRRVIEAIITIEGITIEIIGNWIWVTGNTYPVRLRLKEVGLLFAGKKKAWYYRSEEYASSGSKMTLDEIRAKYGSQSVHQTYRKELK
jgi:hypothetical protein